MSYPKIDSARERCGRPLIFFFVSSLSNFLVDQFGGLPKALCGNVLWSHRVGWLSSAFRRTSTRTCCEFYLDRAGTSLGRLFAMAFPCLSFWRKNPWYISKLEAPGFFKAWIWIRKESKSPCILAKARRTCCHEDHTDTLSKQFTAGQSPWQCFGKTDFFLAFDMHIQCRLFLPIASLHTQKRHKWPWLNIYTS